jgi:hypothetical protein
MADGGLHEMGRGAAIEGVGDMGVAELAAPIHGMAGIRWRVWDCRKIGGARRPLTHRRKENPWNSAISVVGTHQGASQTPNLATVPPSWPYRSEITVSLTVHASIFARSPPVHGTR